MPIYTIKLLDRETVATNTLALTFEKPAGFTFVAGQYGGFTLIDPTETDEKGNTRRFSYFNAPDDEHLIVVTRSQTSAYKRNLENMPIDHPIKMAGAIGKFVLHDDPSIPAVFIAGGIGVTPFYSMIKDSLLHRPTQQIILFYGNQSLEDSAYLDELISIANDSPQLTVIPVLANPPSTWTGEKGFIDDETLIKNIPDIDQPNFYVCGSPAMVKALQQVLQELAIPAERINVEDFPGY